MALTEDQLAQAGRLHGALAWIYPSTDDVGFWDRYFNETVPELTPQEQASGITLGGYGPGEQQAAYQREQASLAQRPAPAPPPAPLVLPPAPGGFSSPPPAPSAPPQWATGGDGIYASSLIKALREATPAGPGNPGVSMLPNQAPPSASAPVPLAFNNAPLPTGLISDPPVLKMPTVRPGRVTSAQIPTEQLRGMIERAYDAAAGDGGAQGGGSSVGQGINNNMTDLALNLMAYGEAGKGLAPGSMAAGLAGSALAGQQVNAMGQAADALGTMQAAGLPPGVVAMSDAHGNVFGFSSPATVADADAIAFGPASTAVDGSTIGTDALGIDW